ncbi:hypothetical protein H257_19044 [Aphanomyces astaci]|uniref:CCHC-type domain-containing protein n=1 Tax=Aphanomyces astaci TaxID=112090 RepID=W4F987_APHAT|nr:hypothetical protein H257_19044 [Aphanomyces astaci]ETV64017.1 hypothetical protein H257_19044 [Aphanomyces astaci]|eukprot:XP_009846498.1 hypothetical protein H257_19044 [Aphanomyces astaci]
MKQLVEQDNRGGLTDNERKSLLGLKLSADKTPATLNAWWIAYSKTKGGDHDSFVDQFGSSIPRDHMDKLSDPWTNPSSTDVAMFKRGFRHARAESCLEHTDRELNYNADFMKRFRTREVRLEEITAKPQGYAKPHPTPPPLRRLRPVLPPVNVRLHRSHLVYRATQQQKAFVALIERSNQVQQGFVEALTRSSQPQYAAPTQQSQPYGFAYQQAAPIQPATSSYGQQYQQPYASHAMSPHGQPALQSNPMTTPKQMSGVGRARAGHIPMVISSKPDEITVSDQNVCGRCDHLHHGSKECSRQTMRCNFYGQMGHYPGEYVKICHLCGQPGSTAAKCPFKPAH